MNRNFEKVIVDEVDNMLLDKANHITMLSREFPGFESLTPILLQIWILLEKVNSNITTLKDGKMYYMENMLISPTGGKFVNIEENNTSKEIKIDDKQKFIVDQLKISLKNMLRDNDKSDSEQTNKTISVPTHLKEFVNDQLENWITSAFCALEMFTKDKQYRVVADENGRDIIKIIDYLNTGVVQNNMSLSDGLTQFLELKEGLQISTEKLVSCFISNVSFLKKYGKNIYGLTGTIGSDKEIETLKKIYSIDI